MRSQMQAKKSLIFAIFFFIGGMSPVFGDDDNFIKSAFDLREFIEKQLIPFTTLPETPVTEGGQEETRQLNQSLSKNEAQDKVQQKTAIPRAIKRDPTMPADYLAKPARIDGDKDIKGELILTAIFSYPDYRCAVINDQVLKVGDVIAGQMIEEIHERSVRLRDSKEITELNLFIPNMITFLEEQNLNKKDSILPP